MGLPFIELPPDCTDFLDRALFPDPEYSVVIDAFDFRSVYRTSDGVGVSFVADRISSEGQREPKRYCMALPDFMALLLSEEGRDARHLTDYEKEQFITLGFRREGIEIAQRDAILFLYK